MKCGSIGCRHELQRRLSGLNPAAAELAEHMRQSSLDYGAWQESLKAGTDEDVAKSGSLASIVGSQRLCAGVTKDRKTDGEVCIAVYIGVWYTPYTHTVSHSTMCSRLQ